METTGTDAMLMIAALGNSGSKYAGHRHNVGFMVGRLLMSRHGWDDLRSKFGGAFGQGFIEERKVAMILPMGYMNRSGESVGKAARYHRVSPESLLVIHDEVELPFGEVRLKEGGGLGGHNGLRSIEGVLGNRDFWRLRVGVGRPASEHRPLADYVLSPFDEPDSEVRLLLENAAELAERWLVAGGDLSAQTDGTA